MKLKKKTKKRLTGALAVFLCAMMCFPLIAEFFYKPTGQDLLMQELMKAQLENAKNQEDEAAQAEILPNIEGDYEVLEIIDGNTLSIMYGQEEAKAKLIGVSIPENMKEKATHFTKEALTNTDSVSLEFDIQDKDKDGNLLVYAYHPDDIYSSLNVQLLEKGYAKLSEESQNKKYIEDLRSGEKLAKEAKLGCWETDEKAEEKSK